VIYPLGGHTDYYDILRYLTAVNMLVVEKALLLAQLPFHILIWAMPAEYSDSNIAVNRGGRGIES